MFKTVNCSTFGENIKFQLLRGAEQDQIFASLLKVDREVRSGFGNGMKRIFGLFGKEFDVYPAIKSTFTVASSSCNRRSKVFFFFSLLSPPPDL